MKKILSLLSIFVLFNCNTVDTVFNEKTNYSEYLDVLNSINDFIIAFNKNEFSLLEKKISENIIFTYIPLDENKININNFPQYSILLKKEFNYILMVKKIREKIGIIHGITYNKPNKNESYIWLKQYWLNNIVDNNINNGCVNEYTINLFLYTSELNNFIADISVGFNVKEKRWIITRLLFRNDVLFNQFKK